MTAASDVPHALRLPSCADELGGVHVGMYHGRRGSARISHENVVDFGDGRADRPKGLKSGYRIHAASADLAVQTLYPVQG